MIRSTASQICQTPNGGSFQITSLWNKPSWQHHQTGTDQNQKQKADDPQNNKIKIFADEPQDSPPYTSLRQGNMRFSSLMRKSPLKPYAGAGKTRRIAHVLRR